MNNEQLLQFLTNPPEGKEHACKEAIDWIGGRDLATSWAECPRGDWMLFFLKYCDCDLRLLTACKAAAAEVARPYMTDSRSIAALDVAHAFGRGGTGEKELHNAADAACAAADAAYAARAAARAAADAAYAARAAADAADAAADAADAAAYAAACAASCAADAAAYAAADAAADAAYSAADAAADAAYSAADAAAYAAAYAAADAATYAAADAARKEALSQTADNIRAVLPDIATLVG